MWVKKGQQVPVYFFDGNDVGIDTGNGRLAAVGPADCDLLEAANKMWSALTPEQRAVDVAAVLKDSSIWPAKVTCYDGFNLDGGKELPSGLQYDLVTISRDRALLWTPEHKAKLSATLDKTDVVKRARQILAIEPAKRPARVAEALRNNLVDASGKTFASDTLGDKKLFLLYYGASWCNPCRQFSPGLVKTINALQADNPNLLVVMMSNDEKDIDLQKYMQDEKMPWPAMTLAKMKDTGFFLGYAGTSIPQVTVLDRYGRVLATSTEMNRNQVMDQFAQLVKSGAAK